MQIAVSLSGLPALERMLLEALPAAVDLPVLRRALVAGAEPIRAGMAANAPRGPDAPHIAENIKTRPLSPSELEAVADDSAGVEIGPTVAYFYGYFWEFGTVKLPARPFARPAFDAHCGTALGLIGTALGAALLEATNKGGRP